MGEFLDSMADATADSATAVNTFALNLSSATWQTLVPAADNLVGATANISAALLAVNDELTVARTGLSNAGDQGSPECAGAAECEGSWAALALTVDMVPPLPAATLAGVQETEALLRQEAAALDDEVDGISTSIDNMLTKVCSHLYPHAYGQYSH